MWRKTKPVNTDPSFVASQLLWQGQQWQLVVCEKSVRVLPAQLWLSNNQLERKGRMELCDKRSVNETTFDKVDRKDTTVWVFYVPDGHTPASECVCTCAWVCTAHTLPYMASSQLLHLETLVHLYVSCSFNGRSVRLGLFNNLKGSQFFEGSGEIVTPFGIAVTFCMLLIIIVIDVLYIDSFSWPRRTGSQGSWTVTCHIITTWSSHLRLPYIPTLLCLVFWQLSASSSALCKPDNFFKGFLVILGAIAQIMDFPFFLSEWLFKKILFSCVAVKRTVFYTTLYINMCKAVALWNMKYKVKFGFLKNQT